MSAKVFAYMAVDSDGAMVGYGATRAECRVSADKECSIVRARNTAVRYAIQNGAPEMWELLRVQNDVVTFAGEVES